MSAAAVAAVAALGGLLAGSATGLASPLDLDDDGLANRLDNCVVVANADQRDTDADGRGDACECGDVDADGRLTTRDARLIRRCTDSTPSFACEALPGICDVDGDDLCTPDDAAGVQRAAVGRLAPEELRCRERDVQLGILADSLADEYNARIHSFDFPLIGLNWVEQLTRSRGLDFGRFETARDVRGEPRNDGFARNWSRYGLSIVPPSWAEITPFNLIESLATLTSFDAQIDGLVAEVAAGRIDILFVQHGHNDFFVHLWCGGATPDGRCLPDAEVPGGLFRGPEFETFSARLVETLFGGIDRIRAAGKVAIVIGEIAEVIPPLELFHPPLSLDVDAGLYADAVGSVNAAIAREAALRGIPFARSFDPVRARLEKPGFPSPAPVEACFDLFPEEENDCVLRIGSERIAVTSVAETVDLVCPFCSGPPLGHGPCWVRQEAICAGPGYALTFFLQDKVHPNTPVQGLMANGVLGALERVFELGIPLLTDDEILDNALTPYELPLPPG